MFYSYIKSYDELFPKYRSFNISKVQTSISFYEIWENVRQLTLPKSETVGPIYIFFGVSKVIMDSLFNCRAFLHTSIYCDTFQTVPPYNVCISDGPFELQYIWQLVSRDLEMYLKSLCSPIKINLKHCWHQFEENWPSRSWLGGRQRYIDICRDAHFFGGGGLFSPNLR